MADLTIVVDARELETGEWQTMSSYEIPPSGKLVFKNAAEGKGDLVISLKKTTPPQTIPELPFCEPNGTTPKTLGPIPSGEEADVKICKGFEKEFLYTAKIGSALEEDPIVIIEKKQSYMLDPWTAGIFGLLVGAGITYFIVRWRDSRRRPQQG